MDRQELLRSVGFTEYEISALIALIKLKTATTKEISFDSGVPQNKLYGILSKFEDKSILESIPSATKRYRLINLKSYIERKIKEKENKLKQLKENADILEETGDDKEEFVFSFIRGQRAIMNKLAEHNSKVKKEILGVQRNWKFWGEGIRAMRAAAKRGVDIKLIGIINPDTEKKALEWRKAGCKIKEYNKVFGEYPLRFTIFDNKEARITIGKPEIQDPKEYITIWTRSQPLIAMLRAQFMSMWKNSKNF